MPRQKTNLEINTFVKGLITEAGPLTFPENASLEDVNFILNRDGSRQRRFGMDFETNAVQKSLGYDVLAAATTNINSAVWKNPIGDGSLDIAVVQVNDELFFFDNSAASISNAPLNGGSSITISSLSGNDATFASIQGNLLVTNGSRYPTLLTYDSATQLVSSDTITIQIRDLFGVEDNYAVDLRSGSLSVAHEWNLRNQGWPATFNCSKTEDGDGRTFSDPVSYCRSEQNVYPANSDLLWAAKISTAKEPEAVGSFWPAELYKNLFGTTPAPKGSAVLDLFERGASRISLNLNRLTNEASLPQDETLGSVSNVGFYSGRVFYAITETGLTGGDANSPKLGTMIFYSQVVDTVDKLGRCYQEADPSAEDINDVIATDGGFISIPEAGRVLSLTPLGTSLIIITTNGVWEVSGGEKGFSASEQKLSKVTSIGALSASSVVVSEDLLSFWSESGIQAIQIDEISLSGKINNITQTSIQELYDNIPVASKETSTAVYDSIARQVRWMYRDRSLASTGFYNKELIFDLNLQAFYESNVEAVDTTFGPFLAGYLDLPNAVSISATEDVVVNDVVVTADGEDVTVTTREVDEGIRASTKYLTFDTTTSNTTFTFSSYSNLDFIDWLTYDDVGIDAPATLVTGYTTGSAGSISKQINALVVHLRRTEEGFTDTGDGFEAIGPSSCMVQAQWQWANSASSGRWGTEFQAYRIPRMYVNDNVNDPYDYGFKVISSKSKLRGRGNSISIKFSTEPAKNLHLYGWGLEIMVDTNI